MKFFSDEKVFTIDYSRNARNDRWIAVGKSQVKAVFTSKKSAAMMGPLQ